ncbi:DUF6292 family protein [Actinocrispum sp. NPDC049592]|uniref:DUF6292 family protein n=1 Tax=Actinocrispum sp. NPDC049592 TaxID=3154835 RepID=UPI00342EF251
MRFDAGLRSYVHAVAAELGVEAAAAWGEVAEPSTAYVAVRERAVSHPDRDVMVLWDERAGWVVALEHEPGEPPVVLARIEDDLVPEPRRVAQVVRAALGGDTVSLPVVRNGDTADLRARISACARSEAVVGLPRI